MVGLTLEATGCQASIGDYCDVITSDGSRVESEVVGFSGDRLYLMPDRRCTRPGTQCTRHSAAARRNCPGGPQLLGRIIDGGAIHWTAWVPWNASIASD